MQLALFPQNLLTDAKYYTFPHPRNDRNATFIIKDNQIFELLKVSRPHSSYFYGNAVVSNGELLYAIPIHPLFLVLPFISSRKKQMFDQNEFFFGTCYSPIAQIITSHLTQVCSSMELSNGIQINYDESLALKWLVSKAESLMPYFREKNNIADHLIIELAYDALRHYLSPDFCVLLRDILREKYPGSFPPLRMDDEIGMDPKPDPRKTKKETKKSSKLKVPEGNMSISSFFVPAKKKK